MSSPNSKGATQSATGKYFYQIEQLRLYYFMALRDQYKLFTWLDFVN